MKISEYDLNTNDFKKEFTINWDEIKEYKCYFSSTNVTYLTLYLRNGSRKNLSFNDKSQNDALTEESVFSLLYAFICQYNLKQNPEDQISFRPGFFTTNTGLFLLVTLLSLAAIMIVFHFVFHPKSAMASFMSFFIILSLFGKRKKDNLLKEKIKDLKPLTFTQSTNT